MIPSCRYFLQQASIATYATLLTYPSLAAQKKGMRLILLGTAGGPTPKKNRAAPAQMILIDDEAYIIDCGNGVAQQIVKLV